MARVLIGWELGANRGHIVRLLHYHDALVAAGHDVVLAVQRIDAVAGEGADVPGGVWQAPVWPRMLAWAAGAGGPSPATMGDILARLGLGEPGVLAALIGGWDAILAAVRPDMVIAEYAPALLCAARGRVPTVAIGNGFLLPPSDMPAFPSLSGAPAVHDEAALLDRVNDALAATARQPIGALPALFGADRALPDGIVALDPYAAWRVGPTAPPMIDRVLPIAPSVGDEIFVYWPERAPPVPNLWRALQACGLPVRLHTPHLSGQAAAALAGAGFRVEPRPLPFAAIAGTARLLLSHGGGGFVAAGLFVGRPQVVVHYDLEKRHNGLAVDRLGLGAQMPLGDFDVAGFAHGLRVLHADQDMADRALARAHRFRADLVEPAGTLIVRMVESLAG